MRWICRLIGKYDDVYDGDAVHRKCHVSASSIDASSLVSMSIVSEVKTGR